ncbi:MAG: ATP-binding protein [Holophagales bacterium]|nr:ATP-binding protein [Holophagales bacterium]
MVTNVLSFTRLERGSMGVQPELGDLEQAVVEAYQRQRMALEESGAEVELAFEPGLPSVAFDRDALTHIVQNLLDNAEKYTRDVGDRRIVLRLAREDAHVVMSVEDNGHGISKSLRRHLFEPYSRGDDSDAPEGLGLGLVLVRMLARAQGADIDYRDAPKGGAVFRVAFPVRPEPAVG